MGARFIFFPPQIFQDFARFLDEWARADPEYWDYSAAGPS
jgi:hypothetical protein